MGGRKPNARTPNRHGLYARNFPKPMRWRLDQDYLDQLTPDEAAWLAEFHDRFYGGDFRGSDPEVWPLERRSDINRTKNASKTDAQGLAELGGNLVSWSPDMDADPLVSVDDEITTPAYLNSQEYKAALAEYRSYLTPTRKNVAPVESIGFARARKKLRAVVKRGVEIDDAERQEQAAADAGRSPRRNPDPARTPRTAKSGARGRRRTRRN